ncbi:MAG: response regulator [Lachnospiraceae bacterium]|nr:response regulator [Lachnospiraceae bacterium]MDD3616727.1 response regulator [Lachnospiraceae bacterium]
MKVVFLDVDGVLNYVGAKTLLPQGTYFVEDEKVELLKEIVDKSNASLVLSSSWRRGWTNSIERETDARCTIEQSQEYFMLCAKLHDYDLSFLSELPRIPGMGREGAIEHWLAKWPGEKIEEYVILDDNSHLFSARNEHLVLTSNRQGLSPENVKEALQILKVTKKKILIVDDVEVNREVLKSALRYEYEMMEAENGKKAIEQLEKNRDTDLVITDIQMPEMDGMELIKQIRANAGYRHIRIIANTQYGDQEQEERIIEMGADDFVYKPSSPKVLMLRVRNALK